MTDEMISEASGAITEAEPAAAEKNTEEASKVATAGAVTVAEPSADEKKTEEPSKVVAAAGAEPVAGVKKMEEAGEVAASGAVTAAEPAAGEKKIEEASNVAAAGAISGAEAAAADKKIEEASKVVAAEAVTGSDPVAADKKIEEAGKVAAAGATTGAESAATEKKIEESEVAAPGAITGAESAAADKKLEEGGKVATTGAMTGADPAAAEKLIEKNAAGAIKGAELAAETTAADKKNKEVDKVAFAGATTKAEPAVAVAERKIEGTSKAAAADEEDMDTPQLPPSDAPRVDKSESFKEESNFLSDLKESEKKALSELRAKVEETIIEKKIHKKKQKVPSTKEKKMQNKEVKKVDAEAPRGAEGKNLKLDQAAQAEPGEAPSAVEKPAPSEEKKADTEAQDNGEGESAKLEQASEAKSKEATLDREKAPPLEDEEDGFETATASSEDEAEDTEFSLWGVPLLPSKGSDRTDVVLLKFLRARDFKVKDAFEMLQAVLRWRKESRIDTILEDSSLGTDLASACYMDGVDREGHPICYNVPGLFQDEALYQKTFGLEEGRERFTRWRVQLMEKGIKRLDFKPGGAASLLQITDLKNSPGPSKKELRTVMKQVVQLFQDNYPELVARNIFINVPFWYYAFNAVISPFLTQRTKSKFVFARPSKVLETLLKYIPAEAIPVRYGGLRRDGDTEFSVQDDVVSELLIKSNSTETVEIPTLETGTTLWDVSVLGWEVNYKEEFIPTDEGSYTILVRKSKKMGPLEEPIRNSFRNNEPGKIVLTIENTTFWKKKVLYRYRTKNSS